MNFLMYLLCAPSLRPMALPTRVGYMMSSAELANYIQTIRLPYNLNTLSQVAAEVTFLS